MIKLIAFSHENQARLLVSHLRHQGLQADYQHVDEDYPHQVILQNEAELNRAQALTQAFLQAPDHRQFQAQAWEQGESSELTQQQWLNIDLASLRLLPVTASVLMLCLLVFGLSVLGWARELFGLLQIAPLAQLSQSQQWWRLFGPAFFHFGLLHLVFNLLWWWVLGSRVERLFGHSALLGVLVFTALVSNLAQLWTSGPNFGGLSGVVYGLMGFVWWIGWLRPQWGLGLPKPLIGFLLVWLLLGYADVLWVNMANSAHTAGLLSGILLALLVTRIRTNPGKYTG